jgi:hypothetical protein
MFDGGHALRIWLLRPYPWADVQSARAGRSVRNFRDKDHFAISAPRGLTPAQRAVVNLCRKTFSACKAWFFLVAAMLGSDVASSTAAIRFAEHNKA